MPPCPPPKSAYASLVDLTYGADVFGLIDKWIEWTRIVVTVRAVATDCIVFVGVFLSVRMITHEPLHSAWWNFARTCISATAWTLFNFKVIGHRLRSFFVSGPEFTNLSSLNMEKNVVNAVFRLSIAWSVPEVFAIIVIGCLKSSALLITHELLHSAWWSFAWTRTLTTARNPENFKVVG